MNNNSDPRHTHKNTLKSFIFFFLNSLNTVFAFRFPHTPSQTAFPQGLLAVTPSIFKYPLLFKPFCYSWLLYCSEDKMTDLYAGWNISMFSFHIFLPPPPFHSSPPTVFHNRHSFIPCKAACFSTSVFSCLCCITFFSIFFPLGVFVQDLSADSYRKRENPP